MIYDDESAQQFFMEAKQVYQDRGMVKWVGFYLSDHTAVLKQAAQKRHQVNLAKKEQSLAEISRFLQQAFLQKKRVSIQLNLLDSESNFMNDLVGKIIGQKDGVIYLAEEEQGILQVEIDQLRHVELLGAKKILDLKE